ncbi:hypothetical protein M877_37960 [Streptomyces niveus NCIMB 11891]|nr:hypothetical protein M877_37960 [Streptomyces niveus NCIMB 11891]
MEAADDRAGDRRGEHRAALGHDPYRAQDLVRIERGEHGHGRWPGQRPQRGRRGDAVPHRHPDVDQRDIRTDETRSLHGSAPVARLPDQFQFVGGDEIDESRPHERVVVHNEYLDRPPCVRVAHRTAPTIRRAPAVE